MAAQRLQKITGHLRQGLPLQAAAAPTGVAGSSSSRPVKVCVTGAAGNIGYALIFMMGQGKMLGPNQKIELRLLDIPGAEKKMQGVAMEIQDCAFPVFSSVTCTTDYKVAFQDVEIALLVGARPRGPGMVRADLLKANASIFAGQGKALNAYANRNVKVLVVGNPANTNALIAIENAPQLPAQNFTAMTRLDQARATGQISEKLGGVPIEQVRNVIIWGNHSKTQYPDVNHAYVADFPHRGTLTPVRTAVNDEKWFSTTFIPTVQTRGAAVIKARGASSAASAANAALDHMRSWMLGTAQGEYVSMGVPSDGSYGVPKGIVFSFPCQCQNGSYSIVQGLPLDADSQARLRTTADELLNERRLALGQ